ncbi:Aste57867_11707 [Aphanomyces stellatus]|uniref:Aste57867_11707 protein n=1 Tax=Aphanomyces stellatus TaxID=120398 RepID=A0A485KTP4_9STRA|nr:hypothetical protein As57867_011664 [Aphanomyces stellatus]VFT88564.1 Aste57867_11707 [Aphanomyces stellatus]
MMDEDEFTSPMPLRGDMEHSTISEEDDDDDDDTHIPVAPTSESEPTGVRPRRLRNLKPEVRHPGASSGRRFKLPGITFRRRRDGEEDKDKLFWNAVMVLSFVALAVLTAISYVLAQTEFFVTHQDDLLGVSIDKIFSVVSDEKTTIYLHNTGHLPGRAMVNYEDHVLEVGRVKDTIDDEQLFYGFSIFHNGTVGYTNELKGLCLSRSPLTTVSPAPTVEAKTVHADSLMFDDGTTMTTAADVSGGLVQEGDLNFASQKASIVAATAGKQRFVINADGLVVIPDPDAMPPDDPNKVGLVFDGHRRRMSFAGQMDLYADKATSGITSTTSFSLAANDIVLGRDGTERVRLTVPPLDKLSFQKPIRVEVSGQYASGGGGGHVVVAGGDGDAGGGQLQLLGGHAINKPNTLGQVLINAIDKTTPMAAETLIGTNTSSSIVVVQGAVQINAQAAQALPVEIGGAVAIRGASLVVASPDVALGHAETTAALLLAGKVVAITTSDLTLGGGTVHVTASQLVANATAGVTIAAATQLELSGHTVAVHAADKLTWTSPSVVITGQDDAHPATVQLVGNIQLGSHSEFAPSGTAVKLTALGGSIVLVGDRATTNQVKLQAIESIHAAVNGSVLVIASAGGVNATSPVAIASSAGLVLGNADTSTEVRAARLSLGAPHIQIGATTSVVDIQGTVTINGKPLARRLDEAAPTFLWLATTDHQTDVVMAPTEEFHLVFDAHHSSVAPPSISSPSSQLSPGAPEGYMQVALTINGLRAETTGLDEVVSLLLRCRVHQTTAAAMTVVLEATVEVDLCPTSLGCLDDDSLSPSLSGQSIRMHAPLATYAVTCAAQPRRRAHQASTTMILRYDHAEMSLRPV